MAKEGWMVEEFGNSLHKMIVPKSLCVGGPKASESYLNISNIIEAAKLSGFPEGFPYSEPAEFSRRTM